MDDDSLMNSRERVTPYEDLFDSISENKRIEVGLRSVIDMREKHDPAIREMAQAVLEEIEFFRQRKRGIYSTPHKRENEGGAEVVTIENNKVCDPLVLEMSQAVLEEIRYFRHQREMQRRCGCIFILFFVILAFIGVSGIIFGVIQALKHAKKFAS